MKRIVKYLMLTILFIMTMSPIDIYGMEKLYPKGEEGISIFIKEAIKAGDFEMVENWIARGDALNRDQTLLFSVNELLYNVGHKSILYTNILKIIEILLQFGVGTDAINEALYIVLPLNDSGLYQTLINYGAYPTLRLLEVLIKSFSSENRNKLIEKFKQKGLLRNVFKEAIEKDKPEIVELLLNAGVEIDENDLNDAELYQSNDVAKILREHLGKV